MTDDREFDWDDARSRSNERKHGIRFEDAIRVFYDPLMLLFPVEHQGDEERWKAYGRLGGHAVIMVAHTYRSQDGREKIRIISARYATRHERMRYERKDH